MTLQIVLARLEETQEIAKQGRIDLGERHTFRSVPKPVSLMWLNKGTEADVAKAKRYAGAEGYAVFTYTDERDPLGRARKDVSK